MLLYGLSAVLIGPTLPGMIATFGLSLTQAGLVGSVQSAGGFLGALLSLWIADRVSHPRTALVSFVLLALALVAIGVAGGYVLVLIAFGLTGLFTRLLDVMLNAHTGELAGRRSGKAMATLHMFFSIGAFAGPIVARAIMGAGIGWPDVYRSIGIVYLLVVVLSARWLRAYTQTHPDPVHDDGGAPRSSPSATDAPRAAVPAPAHPRPSILVALGLLAGALFFYAVHQVGVTSWVPYFLESTRGAGADLASFGLSAYWVGIIVGRFFASRAVERLGAARLLIIGCVISAVATLGAVLTPAVVIAQLLFAIAGMTSGATIPLAYSVGFTILPSRTGSVTAAMSIVMLAGRFLGPWMIGVVADRSSLSIAMSIPGFALLFTGLLAGMVYLFRRRSAPRDVHFSES